MSQLFSDFTRCYELCDNIFETRRIGKKHESLDRLQQGLKSSANKISIQFKSLRRVFGSRMDLGDEVGRRAIKANIRDIELNVEKKLIDIANRREDGLPGFRDMLRRVERIGEDVSENLEMLAQRLEKPAEKPAEKKPEKKPEKKAEKKPEVPKPATTPKKQDEVVMNLKELQKYTDHMKNSWEETMYDGHILYVNCWDQKKNQWSRPDGFIKALPRSSRPSRVPTWEEPPRRAAAEDPWNRPGGW